jgi:streptomycin 6-kinase
MGDFAACRSQGGMQRMIVPDSLRQTLLDVHGIAASRWLDDLSHMLADLAHRWVLTLGEPLPDLSYNLVLSATRADGTPAILKAAPPNAELTAEIAALRHYAGRGAVRLLAADASVGALLLERVSPGQPLTELALRDDEAATSIAAGVMQDLWAAPPAEHPFPTLDDWARAFDRLRAAYDGGTGPFPPGTIARAESLFHDLIASQADPVVLHGDLHHDNILSAGAGWQVIDPKGVIGEPAYEVGALLRNPGDLPLRQPIAFTLRRVDQLAERLSLDQSRLLAWADAQLVLSCVWLVEDHGPDSDWQPWLAFADRLSER